MTKPLNLVIASVLVASPISSLAQSAASTRIETTHKATARNGVKTKRTDRRRVVHESVTEEQIQALRSEMQAQIDLLKQQIAERDARLSDAQVAIDSAQSRALAAAIKSDTIETISQDNTQKLQSLQSTVADLQGMNSGLTQTILTDKKTLQEQIESPASLHYKGITITPVAFFALEGVYRTRAINSGLNTPFNSTPYPGSNEGHVSEFNFSGRQSRVGALFQGDGGPFKLSGYVEADFLSAGLTSNDNQSNSYTLRQRQIWGKAETKSGFAVTGGQMWSLVTEDGKSTDARTEKLPNTIDSQYMVGYNWARQPGIRFQQKFGSPVFHNTFTAALSLENGQIQFAGANTPNNFIFGGNGVGGGLFNSTATYANNVAPDVMVKFAFDGTHSHVEFGGMARFFRDEYFPLILNPTTGVTASYSKNFQKDTKVGGGVFGSARVSPSKFVDVAVQGMAGDGTGRYGSAQLGDVTAHPSGTLEPLRNYHGLASLETHPTKKMDVYAYYGHEYNQRTYYVSNAGLLVGYGVPNANNSGCYALASAPVVGNGGTGVGGAPGTTGACASPTRNIQEGTIGTTYRFVNSPKYGRLQYQFTYSYLTRSTWNGLFSGTYGTPTAVTGSGRATNNMIYAGMRYYIP